MLKLLGICLSDTVYLTFGFHLLVFRFGCPDQGAVKDITPAQAVKIAIDANPELDYRHGVQSADHGVQLQSYLVGIVLGAERRSHVTVGVDVEDDGITNLINDTGVALILHRYVKVVSRSGRHSDVVLPVGDGQKGIECQIEEVLRDAPVRQGNPRLYGR